MNDQPRWLTLHNIFYAIGGVAVVGIVAFVSVVYFGAVNVSAKPPHWDVTAYVLHKTFKNSVDARADGTVPVDFSDPGRIALGAQHYENVCSKCHGGPGLGQNPIALSMRPRPQHLAAVVDEFSDKELYWILQNGVRFSAMPSWPTTKNQDEIWSVVAFLRALPEMSAEEYADLVGPKGDAPQMPYGSPGALADMDVGVKAPPLDEYLYAAPATEWPDIAMTGVPVQRCAACHGTDGTGTITGGHAPNLTVQSAAYMKDALHAYATGQRKSGIMQVVAAGLSDDQITQLADYYAGLPDKPTPPATPASAEQIARGQEIAMAGIPESAVAPCFTCHETPQTEGATLAVPHIAGQSAPFLRKQLVAFRGEGRGKSIAYNPMHHEANYLSDEDIISLAAYFSALEPTGSVGMPNALPEADLANGKALVSKVCSECHEATGVGVASGEYPNLTLQTKEYINQQLHSFWTKQRDSSKMFQTTSRMSLDDMRDVAEYFGQIPPQPTPGTPDMALAAAGEAIAKEGIPDQGVPACLTCHGAEQTRALPLIARLHGQNGNYLERRLDYFAEGNGEQLPGLNPMHDIAAAMTADQRAEVANWFAAQEALTKQF
ncbi:c-type cytochrome [Oceaniglobus roseus]|uniref:c-type cytochrome n=1 Tax=Oceaniglobus roseus TaxID=1737570 RepID=UPI0015621FDC|nr:c-type cytochrome [Kandeliimicrobium roseum]